MNTDLQTTEHALNDVHGTTCATAIINVRSQDREGDAVWAMRLHENIASDQLRDQSDNPDLLSIGVGCLWERFCM
jgi:hypothetical protein